MGVLVTATDTSVGKTLVSAALIHLARRRGLAVGGMKPAESGCERGPAGALIPADATLLQRAAGGEDPLELVCPYRLLAPLAPGEATAEEGVEISFDEIREGYEALSTRHPGGVVVEGAGGLLVPMDARGRTVADLAAHLGLPALVVARGGLGTLNHTALTLEALRQRGLPCRGVILNARDEVEAEAAPRNAAALERLWGVEILAILPPLPGLASWARIEEAARRLEAAFIGRKLDPGDLVA